MILKSNILIVPSMELKKMFLLVKVRTQEDPMLIVEFDSDEGVSGIGYNPKIETLAFWAKQKSTQNQGY